MPAPASRPARTPGRPRREPGHRRLAAALPARPGVSLAGNLASASVFPPYERTAAIAMSPLLSPVGPRGGPGPAAGDAHEPARHDPGCEIGAVDEAHGRAEGRCHPRADDVQPGHRGLVVPAYLDGVVDRPELRPQILAEEGQPVHVRVVAGRRDDVVCAQLTRSAALGEAQVNAVTLGLGPVKRVAGQHRKLAFDAFAQPAGAGRAERGPGPLHPGGLGQVPEQVGLTRVEPGAPAGAKPGFRLAHPLQQRAVRGQRGPVPVHLGRPGDDLDPGPVLVQQGGRLQCRLASAEHDDLLAAEGGRIGVGAAVRAGRLRKPGQLVGHTSQVLDAGGDHDRASPG